MNEKPKETRARVYLRRAVLAALDAAIVAFSFYFALLLRADGAVEAAWWPHNLAILYQNLPWIVAVYVASFLLGGLYSVLWKYAGERDLLRLAVMVAVPTGIVYVVNRRCIHGVLFNSANCMAAVLILLLVGGSSRNALWNQIKANRLGIPIKVLDDAETTVAGAAMFGWYGVGEFSSPEQARAQVAYRYRYFWPQTEPELIEEA